MKVQAPRWLSDAAIDDAGSPPQRRDWWLIATLFVGLLLQVVVAPPSGGEFLALLAVVPALLLLPYRRQIPLHAAMVGFGAQLSAELLAVAVGERAETMFAHDLAGGILFYAVGRWTLSPRAAAGGTVAALAMASVGTLVTYSEPSQLLVVLPLVPLAAFALAMRYRATLRTARETQIRFDERYALARDLHDTVAHHVSAIAIHAQAALFVMDKDPDGARTSVSEVGRLANDAIDDMHRLVGVLRSDSSNDNVIGGVSLDALAVRTIGPAVTVNADCDLEDLPQIVATALFRVAQESVTNAIRHSHDVSTINITLATDQRDAVLSISNDGTPMTQNAPGFGTLGMSERIAALGGAFESGSLPGAGWLVTASVPLRGRR